MNWDSNRLRFMDVLKPNTIADTRLGLCLAVMTMLGLPMIVLALIACGFIR